MHALAWFIQLKQLNHFHLYVPIATYIGSQPYHRLVHTAQYLRMQDMITPVAITNYKHGYLISVLRKTIYPNIECKVCSNCHVATYIHTYIDKTEVHSHILLLSV